MKLGVVMDPIQNIIPGHDSTLALLWEAKARGWPIFYFETKDIFLQNGQAYGDARPLQVFKDLKNWFSFEASQRVALGDLDLILIRNDPPFDQNYLYLTQMLELAEEAGVLIVNKPQALRDINEKLTITQFPESCAPTLVTHKKALLKAFWKEEKDIVCKPLHVMGGQAVFRIKPDDANANVIFETLTERETRAVMAQRFIPEIRAGDKRIMLINGEPIPHVLARIPQEGDWRGNVVAGAKPVVQPLTERDAWICRQLKPFLQAKGIYFAGIDVIGDYLTEINVTSPSCIRELDALAKINVSALLFDFLEKLKAS
jgi:glutathione synthase